MDEFEFFSSGTDQWDVTLFKPFNNTNSSELSALNTPIRGCVDGQVGLRIRTFSRTAGFNSVLNLSFTISAPSTKDAPIINTTLNNTTLTSGLTLVSSTAQANQTMLGFSVPITLHTFTLIIPITDDDLCKSLILDFGINQGGLEPLRITFQVKGCIGNNCDPMQGTTAWDFFDGTSGSQPPSIFSGSLAFSYSNTRIDAADLSPGSNTSINEIAISGSVIYDDNTFPTGTSSSTLTFLMAPGAEFWFGDGASANQQYTVSNVSFVPCAADRFETVHIGPNADITMNGTGSGTGQQSLIYGARTGLTLEPGSIFTSNMLMIDGCSNGVIIDRATRSLFNNVSIMNEGNRPNNTPFASGTTQGATGVQITGSGQQFRNQFFHSFNGSVIDNFLSGVVINGFVGRGTFGPAINVSSDVSFDFGSEITNVNRGIMVVSSPNSNILVNASEVSAVTSAFTGQNSPGTFFSLSASTISAGETGLTILNSPRAIVDLRNNPSITNVRQHAGLVMSSPGSRVNFVNNGNITMNARPNFESFGLGVIGNTNGFTAVNGNTIDLGAIRSHGIYLQSNDNVVASSNEVRVDAIQSVGIETTDCDNLMTNCNQITSTSPTWPASSVGILSNGNRGVNHSCNFLTHVERGLQIVEVSTAGTYSGNGFQDLETGLAVGFENASQNQPVALIGGTQVRQGNTWISNVSVGAIHHVDDRYKSDNEFFADNRSFLNFWPVTGNLANWFTSDLGAQDGNCGNGCFTLPTNWLTNPVCPETESDSDNIGYSWIERAAARYKAEHAPEVNAGIEQPCFTETNCHTSLAVWEQEYYALVSQGKPSIEIKSAYVDSMTIWEELPEGKEKSNRIAQSYRQMMPYDMPDSAAYANTVSDLKLKVDAHVGCDNQSELWKDMLSLALKAELQIELTSSDTSTLEETAVLCSTVEGPGVYIARSVLGRTYSDVKACDDPFDAQTEKLRLVHDSVELSIFPNHLLAGSTASFSRPVSGNLMLTSADGILLNTKFVEEANSFTVPAELQCGLYFLSFNNASGLTTLKLSIHE